MFFSIIVPVYKVEQYLEKCVDSLVHQTFKDIEIILVDDGSPDNCPIMCDSYAYSDSRIRVIHKKNGGLSDARNCGLKEAQGKYVLFIDSDDYIELDTCERFYNFCYQWKTVDILIGDAVVTGGIAQVAHTRIEKNQLCTGREFLKRAFRSHSCPMAAWLNVYKRKYLVDNDIFFKFGILHEDEQFTPRAFLNANSVIYTGILFYHYMIHENSISTKKNKTRNAMDLYNTCFELETIYSCINDEELKKALYDYLVATYLNAFQIGKLYRFGQKYVCKEFVKKYAEQRVTKLKKVIFILSPRVYCVASGIYSHMRQIAKKYILK